MKVLVVYAHPEPKSFNGAMKDLAVNVLANEGHNLKLSDLYAMNFNPVASAHDFSGRVDSDYMNYLLEQRNASENNSFSTDIVEEQQKVRWADFLVFQTPIWWFSVPAKLKGWFDRVLALDFAWGFGAIYDKGLLRGKKAMMAVTTGGPEEYYSKQGAHGATINEILYPITRGTLYFCGMEVLPTFVAWAVFQVDDEVRKRYLDVYKKRLQNLKRTKPMEGHTLLK
jgi:NAD(P)H dehydrogenase (quinone)